VDSHLSNAKPVSSDVYTREYFLKDRKGSIEFVNTGGHHLCSQHANALELGDIRRGQFVLDIGSGCGELVFHCALKGARAIGIDYAPAAIELANEALVGFPV